MPRLDPAVVARVEGWIDRFVSLTESLAGANKHRWLIEQMGRSGTSVGANLFEADQAVSRADFCKCVGISVKELSESRFWIRLVGRRGWIDPERLRDLEGECVELQKILNAMIVRTRRG